MELSDIVAVAAQKGLSEGEVMRRAQTGNSFFWRWRNGKLKPRQHTIDRVVKVIEEA